jgi:hypothetical protein
MKEDFRFHSFWIAYCCIVKNGAQSACKAGAQNNVEKRNISIYLNREGIFAVSSDVERYVMRKSWQLRCMQSAPFSDKANLTQINNVLKAIK